MAEQLKVAPAAPTPQKFESAADFVNAENSEFKQALGLEFTEAAEAETAEQAKPEPAPSTAQPAQTKSTEAPPAEVATEVVAQAPAAKAAEAQAVPTETAPQPPFGGRELLTKFAVHDKEGELEVPELYVDLKANGKDYDKVPLDKVVLLAQMGFANQEREAQVLAAKRFVSEAQEREQSAQGKIEQYEAHLRRLLEEPEFYSQAREEYAMQNSPEQRARRAEAQLAATRAAHEQERADSVRFQFVERVLSPVVHELLTKHPTVSQEELLGRYTLLTAPMLQRGAVPLERLPEVEHLVRNDLSEWVREQHAVRELDRKKSDAKSAAATTAARTQVTLAKRELARAVAPSSPGSKSSGAKPAKKQYQTAQEWLDDYLPVPTQEE